jgi:hypothetical protein
MHALYTMETFAIVGNLKALNQRDGAILEEMMLQIQFK